MQVRFSQDLTPYLLLFCVLIYAAASPHGGALADPTHRQPAAPGLPPSPELLGKLKRGVDGRIIRTGPSDSRPDFSLEEANKSPSPPAEAEPLRQPQSSTPFGQIYSTRGLDELQGHSDHERRAYRQQIEIDGILRDEARAKKNGASVDTRGLTVREIALLEQLQRRDREVRRHEMAHFQNGQPYAQFPQYFYVTGPLNRQFAISGIVKFDASPVRGDIRETLFKLEKLRRAALAPRTPSLQDRQVAAELALLISTIRAGRRDQ